MTEPADPQRRGLLALALGLPLLGAGCVSLVAGTAPRRFRLANPTSLGPEASAVDWTLEVDNTFADPGIDTARIAQLSGNGLELQYYPDAEWPSPASDMITKLIIQTFVDSRLIPRVGDRNSGLRPDFMLKTVLRDFQAEAGASPNVKVTLTASLVQTPRRIQAGAERFQATAPAASAAIEDVVRAFEKATERMLRELAVWTLSTGAAAQR
ncbi:MAG: membrane integrity-associated transporter subunit PqiC [Alphaproteobacteria bacterium]|nr:membrane integrity-associated transporter subunit PqiC [Alphaproteobacteria bacterium]